MREKDETNDEARPPPPGFRLSKLEVYNWGTFDGTVYSVQPRGDTTLLVGENGSGKSTLVDALLTLLVRPQTRNYNVAAGATKNERDEKTYIRGAYDRTTGDAGRPQIQYLWSGSGTYTALLATFVNAGSGAVFTICQVLYLNSENSVEKVYAYCDEERGIVQDLGGLTLGSGIAKILRDKGYRTTTSYKQYFSWLQRTTGFRAKAMDIFNQTVAVKDVQRLDSFIRSHMLEKKNTGERISSLVSHFSELSEAHRMLVRVRQQDELLKPVVEAGQRYEEKRAELADAIRLLDATELFFATETVQLLQPMCDQWRQQVQYLNDEINRLDQLQRRLNNEIARLEIEIENAGGDRLRQIPGLIEQEEQIAKVKAAHRLSFESQLRVAKIDLQVTSSDQLYKARQHIHQRRRELNELREQIRDDNHRLQVEIGALARRVSDDSEELQALERRKGNLPESFISLRDRMCRDLRLSPSELPFAAELIAVDPVDRDWEASIEQVMYGFSRSLLVSNEFYSRVAGYVDQTRLLDGRGQGQRLTYLRIGTRSPHQAEPLKSASLVNKLTYREDHPLTAWVRAEIRQRFDYLACDTIEQFQMANGAAMTRNRHVKSGTSRHEKDDRAQQGDRRNFVLGWDNREKRLALSESIRNDQADLESLRSRSKQLDTKYDHASQALDALDQATKVEDFDTIDNLRHEYRASELRLERQRLEDSDDQICELRSQAANLRAETDGYHSQRDAYISDRTTKQRELAVGEQRLDLSQRVLRKSETDGVLESARHEFPLLRETVLAETMPAKRGRSKQLEPTRVSVLTLETLGTLPDEFERRQRQQVDRLRDRLVPIAKDVTSAMTRFLKRFPDEQADLDADVASLTSFAALYERISQDDLPKHEERFKKRLNEKVLHEIGLLHGGLENERQEIRDKIEQLNTALRLLQWKPGTFMRLEPSDIQEREIQDFRRELAGCLSGTLDGTAEANEATFVRIEKFVARLRDDANYRWREKVIDVRNWFNFAAREYVAETGEPRSYYDGGTGQSGGEKGKLAFLVLVAAIAYQYDLDPEAEQSNRFHFVMVDEMFSRSDDQHAEYALELFERFGLQLLIVAPLDAKARVTEPYVGTYLHVVKNKQTHRSELLSITAEELRESTVIP